MIPKPKFLEDLNALVCTNPTCKHESCERHFVFHCRRHMGAPTFAAIAHGAVFVSCVQCMEEGREEPIEIVHTPETVKKLECSDEGHAGGFVHFHNGKLHFECYQCKQSSPPVDVLSVRRN